MIRFTLHFSHNSALDLHFCCSVLPQSSIFYIQKFERTHALPWSALRAFPLQFCPRSSSQLLSLEIRSRLQLNNSFCVLELSQCDSILSLSIPTSDNLHLNTRVRFVCGFLTFLPRILLPACQFDLTIPTAGILLILLLTLV